MSTFANTLGRVVGERHGQQEGAQHPVGGPGAQRRRRLVPVRCLGCRWRRGQIRPLRAELDKAVNRATAEALKQKAAKIGQIKEMTEDPESGSLTIVVEV